MINMEYRNGMDAIRSKIALGQMSELDVAIILGRDAKEQNSAAYLSYRTDLLGLDTMLIALRFKEHTLFGLDIQGNIKGAGKWFEIAHVKMNDSNKDSYLRLSTGLEYYFPFDFTLFGEYHYNGVGDSKSENYLVVKNKSSYTDAGVYLYARNYLTVGLTYQVHPLSSLSLQAINNIDDQSTFITSKIDWNFIEDSYLDLGFFWGAGKTGPNPSSSIKSEFGNYPKAVYFIMRNYF
jgi:hypothetical protein